MIAETNSAYDYHVGGSLPLDAPTYVRRKADDDLYLGVLAGQFCYVLNSRQMGKSSLRVQTMQRLQAEGITCAAIDLTAIGSQDITPNQWYAGVTYTLANSCNLVDKVDVGTWWCDREFLSPVQRLSEFIREVLLKEIPQNLVIFVDEIDSALSLTFHVDDFFALIRSCYNNRADQPEYNRLTWALLGVATPSNLIRSTNYGTPFNIGLPIELTGFQLHEVQPLAQGLVGKVSNPQAVLREVLTWTGGQPFLTQKLCKLVLQESEISRDVPAERLYESGEFLENPKSKIVRLNFDRLSYRADSELVELHAEVQNPKLSISAGSEAEWIENLVRSRLIENWEATDEPQHLRTIRDRLLKSGPRTVRLLGLYQQILQYGEVVANDYPEQLELRLSGLVVKQDSKLKVYSRIYQSVFNLGWVEEMLANLRPYGSVLAAWEASMRKDESYLLCGQALQDALAWAADKSLSDQDYQFLTASQKKANEILNQIVWELVSPLCIEEISPQVETLLNRLRQVSGDDSLRVLKIKAGSTVLVLQSSQEAFERIRTLFGTGQLTELLGIPIQDVRYAADAIELTPELRPAEPDGSADAPPLEDAALTLSPPHLLTKVPVIPSSSSQSPIPNSKARVLIVDDNPDVRDYVSQILQQENYQVWTARNGDEGFRVAEEWRPNLIVTDLMMPVVSGLDMIRMIRASVELKGTPIILLTPKADEAARIEVTANGADAYLSKPFHDRELLAQVRNLLVLKVNEQRVAALNTYLTESVLERFLPPATVQKALRGELELDLSPEPRLITILSSDIVGFNQLANMLRSRRVAQLLNEYLEAMSHAVFDNGGTLDKFMGDSTLAFFGAPEELTPNEQAQRALAAARQMLRSLEELNQRWQEQGIVGENGIGPVRFRCGIHQGAAVVGMFGSKERSDYTAIGPSVNVASRLQEAAEPNSILVSATVADYLDDNVVTKDRLLQFKGVDETVGIFRVKPEWLDRR
jgi:class 3 adenylate cyclase